MKFYFRDNIERKIQKSSLIVFQTTITDIICVQDTLFNRLFSPKFRMHNIRENNIINF